MRILVLVWLFISSGKEIVAQWGLHTTIFHLESATKWPNLTFLVGLDIDLSIRTSIALDFTYGLGDPTAILSDEEYYGTSSVSYKFDHNVIGLTYRSQYFFRDNDRVALYMGPFLGFRKTDYTIKPNTTYDYNTGLNIQLPTTKLTKMTFPVGMRFGFRNGLSGYCQDNYFSIGYNVGADSGELPDYLETRHEFSKLFIQLGFTFGIGWDRK